MSADNNALLPAIQSLLDSAHPNQAEGHQDTLATMFADFKQVLYAAHRNMQTSQARIDADTTSIKEMTAGGTRADADTVSKVFAAARRICAEIDAGMDRRAHLAAARNAMVAAKIASKEAKAARETASQKHRSAKQLCAEHTLAPSIQSHTAAMAAVYAAMEANNAASAARRVADAQVQEASRALAAAQQAHDAASSTCHPVTESVHSEAMHSSSCDSLS